MGSCFCKETKCWCGEPGVNPSYVREDVRCEPCMRKYIQNELQRAAYYDDLARSTRSGVRYWRQTLRAALKAREGER